MFKLLSVFLLVSAAFAVEVNPAGSCPGWTDISVFGVPNARVAVVTGGSGQSVIPQGMPCAGTRLSVANPSLQQVVTLDANGVYRTGVDLPAAACNLYVQGIDLSTCQVSLVQPL